LYSHAVYKYEFNDLSVTDKQFNRLITEDFAVGDIANYTLNNDYASNLLIWCHYTKSEIIRDKFQRFSLLTQPGDVFNRNYKIGKLLVLMCSRDNNDDADKGKMIMNSVMNR
jgi:hypothetical protein